MSLEQDAFDDAFRTAIGFLIARLVRKFGLPTAAVRADLQMATAALAASVEPVALHPVRRVLSPDDTEAWLQAIDLAIPRLTGAVLNALALPAPDVPFVPPDPPFITLGDLDDALAVAAFVPPPFLRVEVTRDGEPLGMLSLVPAGPSAGWSWRSLVPGVASAATRGASPLAVIPPDEAGRDDAVALLYPVVPGPG